MINKIQEELNMHHANSRQQGNKFSEVIEKQRQVIYGIRQEVLDHENILDYIVSKVIPKYLEMNPHWISASDLLHNIMDKGIENSELMWQTYKNIILKTIDSEWITHIDAMERLQEQVDWVSIQQKDPVMEYKKQWFEIFSRMIHTIRNTIITKCENITFEWLIEETIINMFDEWKFEFK